LFFSENINEGLGNLESADKPYCRSDANFMGSSIAIMRSSVVPMIILCSTINSANGTPVLLSTVQTEDFIIGFWSTTELVYSFWSTTDR
jgi:hypothetical protein